MVLIVINNKLIILSSTMEAILIVNVNPRLNYK